MVAIVLLVLAVGLLAPAAPGAQERQLEPTIVVDSATAPTTAPVASAPAYVLSGSRVIDISSRPPNGGVKRSS